MSESSGRLEAPTSRVVAAFAAVYLIWGSTYLAIRFAIETLPPFLMLGARYLVAGAVLYGWLRFRGAPRPRRAEWGAATVIGGLLLLAGNGAVAWAEQRVASGVAALLVALVPVWMVLVDWARPGGTRPSARVLLGLLVGFIGLGLLVGPGELGGGAADPLGAGALMLGSIAWAGGSIYSRHAPLPSQPLLATAIEMLAGGALLTVAGLSLGEGAALDLGAITGTSALAVLYLIVFGSLVGYTAYTWLLQVSTPARVSTYAYVNPVVAVFLGWALAGEPLTARVLLAAAVIIAGVAVITMTRGGRGGPRRGPTGVGDEGARPASAPAVTRAGGFRRRPRPQRPRSRPRAGPCATP
ncbi:MAG TPA: EamA family transporter [Longimicrobiales bacterium]